MTRSEEQQVRVYDQEAFQCMIELALEDAMRQLERNANAWRTK